MPDRTPTVASGARTTVAGIVSTRLKIDMGDIYMYESEGAALFTALSLIGKEKAINKTVSWHIDELRPKFMRINGGTLTSGTTTITVDTPMGDYVQPNYLVMVTRTGETMMSVTGSNATTLEVTRSWGATAAAALLDNDEIMILGPAYGEGASLSSAISTTEVQYSNNLHTMRHNWHIGGLLQELSNNGGTYGGKDPVQQRRKMLSEHKRDMNLALLFSEAATSGGQATGDGITEFILTNASGNRNTATVLTEPVFEDGNRDWFRGGDSDRRVLLCSRQFHGIVNQFPKSVIRTKTGDTKYGLNMTEYVSAHGQIKLIREIALEGDEYDGWAVGFDPSKVLLKVARDTRIIKDRQGVSADAYEEEVLTDFAGVWGQPYGLYAWTDIVS